MNKFKRKPVPFSPVTLGRQMAADAQRMRKKIEKQKPVDFSVSLLPDEASETFTIDDMNRISDRNFSMVAYSEDGIPIDFVVEITDDK